MTKSGLQALLAKPDKVPAGFKTVLEWGAEWKLHRGRASELLREAFDKGLCTRQVLRVQTSRGLYPTPHYKFLKS